MTGARFKRLSLWSNAQSNGYCGFESRHVHHLSFKNEETMKYIDGSQGEGGGQILRTSLTMAMLTGTDIKIEHIRAGRAKPGLMRQHLACVLAAQKICRAKVSGAKVGSTSIIFKPESIQSGDYEFSVGTAGSTLLIFQTVLPALLVANGESRLKLHGGTHNMMAPSFDFINLAFLPVLKQMGIEVDIKLLRHGFFPQGGGEWRAVIKPAADIKPVNLLKKGELISKRAVVTSSNIPEHIAQRELAEISRRCGWSGAELCSDVVDCLGSGNIVSMRLQHENCSEVIEHVGKVGISAERVARNAVKDLQRYHLKDAAVGEHLADQLLLPMFIGNGGVFRTLKPSLHTRTNRDIIHIFTDKRFKFEELDRDLWEIRL